MTNSERLRELREKACGVRVDRPDAISLKHGTGNQRMQAGEPGSVGRVKTAKAGTKREITRGTGQDRGRRQGQTTRHTPIKKRRSKPRAGRVVNAHFMSWVHKNFGCLVASAGGCGGPLTWHHLRYSGSPKVDTDGVMLCFSHHQIQGGAESIEAMGREKWQERFGVELAVEAARYRQAYADAEGK